MPAQRNLSIFLRNIAPNISKAEIMALCRRIPGFIRVALSEPQPDRRFFRRGWVTFSNTVNIKDICWSLQNIRLRECELSPVVNRDLARRMRTVNSLTQHEPVARHNARLAARIVKALDERCGLWVPGQEWTTASLSDGGVSGDRLASARDKVKECGMDLDNNEGIVSIAGDEGQSKKVGTIKTKKSQHIPAVPGSQNPLLQEVTAMLRGEEWWLAQETVENLGNSENSKSKPESQTGAMPVMSGIPKENIPEIFLHRDKQVIAVLDQLLFYLRIVHSVDFYNHSEYAHEHDMPNRCGVIHIRAAAPVNKIAPGDGEF
uniref:Uncharacterized protein n=1 Tax=Eptatretus burgeri TaxID=7764 RepID=A0A8C4QX82_EPTBU